MLSKRMRDSIVVIVTGVWLLNFAAQFFVPMYEVDPIIHAIFGTIVGGSLALKGKDETSNGKGPA